MSGLMQRAVTAIVFVAVMLGGLFFHKNSFLLLFGLITILSLWEFFTIGLKTGTRDLSRKIVGVALGITPYIMGVLFHLRTVEDPDYLVKCLLIFTPLLFLTFIFELTTRSVFPFSNVGSIFLGVIYVGVPFTLLQFIALDGDHFYPTIVLGLLLLTWANDTGAYVIGSMIGKTPLFPRISPKKTWEGSTGGVVVTFTIAWLLSIYIKELTLTNWLVLAGLVSVFASLGDLVESMLKRSLGIKDSGTIMPGHGGFLDRFDAFLFVLPFAAGYLLWIR
ncbi:MAG: phosphatidate cytidylyltransferase [Bacteroidota bacterium]